MRDTFRRESGHTLIEALAVLVCLVILAAAAVPTGLSQVEIHRLDGAARYMTALFFTARSQAVRRSAFVAVRFEADPGAADMAFRTYVDGNANGVRTRDIADGVDRPLTTRDRLGDHFTGVRFGIASGVSGIDPGDVLSEGDDPIRFGAADLVSFSPNGSVTSGTVYIRSAHGQRAVRLLGATGRTRLLWFSFAEGQWIEH